MKKKLLIITILCIIIDQITKLFVVSNLDVNTGFRIIPSLDAFTHFRVLKRYKEELL